MTEKRKQYSKQFKIDAVKLVTKQGYKVSETARSLGIDEGILRQRKKQLTNEDAQAFPGNGKMSLEKEELIRLRKENKQLKMEKGILKAVGWATNKRMKVSLVKEALAMAYFRRRPGKGLIHHSDRGSQ